MLVRALTMTIIIARDFLLHFFAAAFDSAPHYVAAGLQRKKQSSPSSFYVVSGIDSEFSIVQASLQNL